MIFWAATGLKLIASRFQIAVVCTLGFQMFPEAANGRIGDGVQVVEDDAIALEELRLIGCFQLLLRAGRSMLLPDCKPGLIPG